MGLFGKNYKKINALNKQKILELVDKLLNTTSLNANELNNIKNNILSQAESDKKELGEIDNKIIASLNQAIISFSSGNAREGDAYVLTAKKFVGQRAGASSTIKPKKPIEIEIDEDLLIDIMLNKAQDAVANAAKEYNQTKILADRGDIAAQAKLTMILNKYNIAQQNFNAISANLNREAAAKMMKEFTEEQKQRIANRTISDEELADIVNDYNLASNQAIQEGADVNILSDVIKSNASANSTEGMPSSLNVPGQASGMQGMPSNLNVPGANQNVGFNFGTGANPFDTQANDNNGMSTSQLRGAKNMLENQIEDLQEELEDKRADRRELDSRIRSLLEKHSKLPDAQAKLLESEIDSLQVELENSDFELNNIQQEILQLQENKGIIIKLLSVNTRNQRESMLKNQFGSNFDVEKFAMYINEQQQKFNENLQKTDDANAVSRAENLNTTRQTVASGASYNATPKKNYDDLKKNYGVGNN